MRFVSLMMDGFNLSTSPRLLVWWPTKLNLILILMGPQFVKEGILERIGFCLGSFPIKYLGMPLLPAKWSVSDCQKIVENIKARLQIISTRHISYAAKSQLINTLLVSVLTYWSSIFMIPQTIL